MADLKELQQKAARIGSLEAKLRELQNQARLFEREVISLKVSYSKEQADIDKLEGKSLANYFCQGIGRLDDKLDKERQEAYAAKVKLDGARAELENIRRDISHMQSALAEARTAEYLLQQEMIRMQQEQDAKTFTAKAGGGMVSATVNGKHELIGLEINPEAVDPDDVEMLQDMVLAAVNEAMRAADAEAANNMSRLTGGMNLGGLF